jgi:hypothetical protein
MVELLVTLLPVLRNLGLLLVLRNSVLLLVNQSYWVCRSLLLTASQMLDR